MRLRVDLLMLLSSDSTFDALNLSKQNVIWEEPRTSTFPQVGQIKLRDHFHLTCRGERVGSPSGSLMWYELAGFYQCQHCILDQRVFFINAELQRDVTGPE